MAAVPVEVSDVASAPPTPPSRRDACGVEGASPSKRRRARAAVSKGRLWLRTRWETLAAEEDEENRVDFREEVDKLVQVKFELLAEGLVLGVADTLKAVIAAAGLLTTEDMNGVRDEIRQQFQLDIGRLDSRVDSMAGLANVQKEGQLQTCMKRVHDLKQDLLDLRDELEERGMLLHDQDSCGEEDRTGDDKYHDDAELQEFRKQLGAGMPVHVAGLVSRPELDGTAGYLEKWHEEEERWQIRLGTETLLVRPDNIVP